MANTENILDALPGMNRHMRSMRAASGAEEIVDAMRKYLAGWSTHKIDNLQKIDGGWGPFDRNRQPARLSTVGDVLWIGESVRRHRFALSEAGIAPNPELVELDLFCCVARQAVENRVAVRSRTLLAAPRGGAYPQWGNSQRIDRHS